MGGAAERHFRKARPGVDDLPWGTLNPSEYDPSAVNQARSSWTEVAINEYRAVASFSEVLRALVDVKAPLDLLGMTSDFLADECSHVELASRMAMELGGAAPREVDFNRFTPRPRTQTAFQRANELVLRVGCIAEAFSGGTATVSYASTSHGLPRAVYETILRDEAHHRRLGGLYLNGRCRASTRTKPAASARCSWELFVLSRRSGSPGPHGRRQPRRGPRTTSRRSGGLAPRSLPPSRERWSCATSSTRSRPLASRSAGRSERTCSRSEAQPRPFRGSGPFALTSPRAARPRSRPASQGASSKDPACAVGATFDTFGKEHSVCTCFERWPPFRV